jgi:hypothetical protein
MIHYVAPGLGMTFAIESSRCFAFSNMASKIAIGILVIPHYAADMGSWFVDEDVAGLMVDVSVSPSFIRSRYIFFPSIPVF